MRPFHRRQNPVNPFGAGGRNSSARRAMTSHSLTTQSQHVVSSTRVKCCLFIVLLTLVSFISFGGQQNLNSVSSTNLRSLASPVHKVQTVVASDEQYKQSATETFTDALFQVGAEHASENPIPSDSDNDFDIKNNNKNDIVDEAEEDAATEENNDKTGTDPAITSRDSAAVVVAVASSDHVANYDVDDRKAGQSTEAMEEASNDSTDDDTDASKADGTEDAPINTIDHDVDASEAETTRDVSNNSNDNVTDTSMVDSILPESDTDTHAEIVETDQDATAKDNDADNDEVALAPQVENTTELQEPSQGTDIDEPNDSQSGMGEDSNEKDSEGSDNDNDGKINDNKNDEAVEKDIVDTSDNEDGVSTEGDSVEADTAENSDATPTEDATAGIDTVTVVYETDVNMTHGSDVTETVGDDNSDGNSTEETEATVEAMVNEVGAEQIDEVTMEEDDTSEVAADTTFATNITQNSDNNDMNSAVVRVLGSILDNETDKNDTDVHIVDNENIDEGDDSSAADGNVYDVVGSNDKDGSDASIVDMSEQVGGQTPLLASIQTDVNEMSDKVTVESTENEVDLVQDDTADATKTE